MSDLKIAKFQYAGTLVLGPFTDKPCNVIFNNLILP